MPPPYSIAFSGSILRIDSTENKLPISDVNMRTIPKIISVPILNCTGTASGSTRLVSNVSTRQINVTITERINESNNNIFYKHPFVKPYALSTPNSCFF